MKGRRVSTILYIVVFAFVFIMFALTTYSYYLRTHKENTEVNTKTFNMMVEFDNNNQITQRNLKNGLEIVKEFSVKNYSKDTIGKYSINFEIITPLSLMVDEDFTYTLESTSESKDTSNKTLVIDTTPVPVMSRSLGTASITPNNTHTYKLTIKLNNNKYQNDSLFAAKINIAND